MSCCRICLCVKPRKDVTQLKLTNDSENISYEEIMQFCLGVQVTQRSNITTKLCVKCYRKILEFYTFKSLAQKSDTYLRSIDSQKLKNEVFINDDHDHIKTEILSDIEDSGDGHCASDNDNLEVFQETAEVFLEPLTRGLLESAAGGLLERLEGIKNNDEETDNEDYKPELKLECKIENESDEELLSVFKKIKYEFVEDTKENAPVKKKRGRPRKPKPKPEKKEMSKSGGFRVCEECGQTVRDLRQHALKHLPKDQRPRVICDICNKYFAGPRSLKKHIQRKHLGTKQKCHICDKSVQNLKIHIRTIHEQDTLPFQCFLCHKRFISKRKLDEHLTTHTKDRPHECDICGKKFRLKIVMVMHKRQVHNKERPHLCQFCPKSFFKKDHLQVHLRSHTKEKPHPCPDCGKHFTSTSTLRNHRFVHSSEKKFNCDLCDLSFASPNYLRAHMISHVKDKRYPCQFCGTKFHRSDHRKRHEFTAHLKHSAAAAAAVTTTAT